MAGNLNSGHSYLITTVIHVFSPQKTYLSVLVNIENIYLFEKFLTRNKENIVTFWATLEICRTTTMQPHSTSTHIEPTFKKNAYQFFNLHVKTNLAACNTNGIIHNSYLIKQNSFVYNSITYNL